ncbi:MAG: fibronectin type III domain-containing protein [Actinomycetota bacterium]|nr:fibronectin type III domain-containing protein [Actinomycetota bacterium]
MKEARAGLMVLTLICGVVAGAFTAAPALALSPAVESLPASSIEEKGATLKGKVNPGGAETKAYFEYGTTTAYGSKTAEVSLGSGTSTLEHSQAIGGLSANTTYHYRIVAINSTGSAQGVDKTFTTTGPPQVATFFQDRHAGGESATLRASVDPNGQSTTYQFEYGTASGSYSTTVPVPAGSAGSGTSGTSVSYKITGLTPGVKYFWRPKASNAGGTAYGIERSFFSAEAPSVQTSPASEVLSRGATLNGKFNMNGRNTKYFFEYGPTTAYGSKAPAFSGEYGSNFEEISVTQPIWDLQPNTVYHYRLVAENSVGTTYGADETFTTIAGLSLRKKGGEVLTVGAPLKVFASGFTFSTESGGKHTCSEAEFGGEVAENPGALQSVTATKLQNAWGLGCPWSGYTVKYSIPTSGLTILYDHNGLKGLARSKMTLIAATYAGSFKVGEAKYNLVLSGEYSYGVPLEMTLSGRTEPIEGNMGPESSTASATFVVTSGGTAVEAKP